MGYDNGQVLANPILLDSNITIKGATFQYISDVSVLISQKELIIQIISGSSKGNCTKHVL